MSKTSGALQGQIGMLLGIRAIQCYEYSVSPLQRAAQLFPEAAQPYLDEWSKRFAQGQGSGHMDHKTWLRYAGIAMTRYGDEAEKWVALVLAELQREENANG